ncbi:unnamed protein product [Ectocarpus sp. 12 AP-2014]
MQIITSELCNPFTTIMASKRPVGNGDGPQSTTKYQKVSGREHVLLRPDMYVGATNPALSENTIIDGNGNLQTKHVMVAPAFLQCFEEILMNAADRVSAAHESGSTTVCRTKTIIAEVSPHKISIFNDGDGIFTGVLEEHGNIRAPELIFGHLLSSSNYDDSIKRLNSGRQGCGSKLTNIFSTTFMVETVDAEAGVKYRQTFEDNMSVINPPVLTKFSGKAYTKITYLPDFARFSMPDKITVDIEGIFRRRCYEISSTSMDQIKVFFNGKKIPTTKIDHYAALYVPNSALRFSAEVSERWRVSIIVTPDHGQFRAISFVNSTATLDGGEHVKHVVDPLVKRLLDFFRKKFKSPSIKPSVIKDCLTVVVSAFIESPVYRSQCKNYLSSVPANFGSMCELPDSFVNKIAKSGLTEAVESHLKSKEKKVLNATDGKKSSKIRVAKLHDAAKAGTRDSPQCVLFLCEGDSALTFLMSGLKSSDRDHCGCFPLKGKLLNIRDASASQVAANTEITNLKKILGLQQGKTYVESRKELRYGSIVLLVDADTDGEYGVSQIVLDAYVTRVSILTLSQVPLLCHVATGAHIAGLLLNVFDCFWPVLIETGFIKIMATPIVRVTAPRGQTKLFYNEFEYLEWQKSVPNVKAWSTKYYKVR